ncbi:hypothetical protein [Hymenobacter negativus]|uniref:Uncharacterized protein n=1 Tax=Hymenobacter negativus TaxID=2795026 RepID=A0ABS0Q6B8_9BACT|nr:hypothetical protein [Hymenobacter negativus]MBH8557913.1 hypothetical protein [Hymenobacter negativus]
MATPLLFTPELMSAVKRTEHQHYKNYFQYLIQEPGLEPVRQQLEEDLQAYPSERISKTLGEIKSQDKKQSISAIAEVQAFRRLKKAFTTVEIEKPLEIVGGKTPDFWVDDALAFEVFAVFDEAPSQQHEIISAINQIISDVKVVIRIDFSPDEEVDDEGKPIKQKNINFKPTEIKKAFIELFQKHPTPTFNEPFFLRFRDGLIISGYFWPLPSNYGGPTVFSVIESYSSNDESKDYIKSIRKRLQSKLSKYKSLTEEGIPLVVILYNKNHWIQSQDITEVLYGTPTSFYDGEKIIEGPTKDGIIRINQNRALSAVLIKQDDVNTPFKLIENPHARAPLSEELKAKIITAFEIV